ncbi:hypothetical protein P692DRAFT_201933464 [Suillus brevipes Sb2]|nr:hypothetical protein P692DRAFT_201933464 [Suillus brevipes Sb2]
MSHSKLPQFEDVPDPQFHIHNFNGLDTKRWAQTSNPLVLDLCRLLSRQTHYDVEVIQFWQGQIEYLRPHPLHWVPTDPGVGNTYHLVGNTETYTMEIRRNQPHVNPDDWRGSHTRKSGCE